MTGYNDSTAYAFELFETHERVGSTDGQTARAASVRVVPSRTSSAHAVKQASSPNAVKRTSAAAPKKAAEPKKKVPAVQKVASKSKKQLKAETKHNAVRAAGAAFFLAVVFSALSLQISALTEQYELFREINATEQKIEIAKSENIRLNSALNGITGIGAVDNYATKILGMTKAEKYQVKCVDLSDGDKVLFSSKSQVLSALSVKSAADSAAADDGN